MNYTSLGSTGLRVSRLCFGTMSFGGDADEATSSRLFARCREAGINFFDCANAYSGGKAEEILGKLIKGHRDELVITSKVFNKMGEGPNDAGLSRGAIMKAVEASLKRLQTDRLDVYFCHMFDPKVPMEETLRAMDDLVRQGKVRFPAVSNWSAWQIMKSLGISALDKLSRVAVLEPMYSLVKRQVESEILPMALSENLGVITYSPLGGGLLTGKYRDGMKSGKGRLIDNKSYAIRYAEGWQFETASALAEHAKARGMHPATLAVAWVMGNPAVTAPIIGAHNLEQLEPSLKAAEVDMNPEWRKEISALSHEPAVATDRTEER